VILLAFVAQFPLRVFGATLAGLQDLTFCSVATAVSWALTTCVSVVLVLCGWGLYALAAGWSAGALAGAALNRYRFRRRFPAGRSPSATPPAGRPAPLLRASVWASVGQLAQLLTNGTDLLVLAWVIGPETAVVYSCTAKLVALAANQCYVVVTTAVPALSQIRGTGDRARLASALRAVGLSALVLTGAVAVVVVAVNEAFVTRWVGSEQFGGPVLTLLIVGAMVARQLGFTWWAGVYVLGYERRLALVMLLDGIVTATAMVLWTAAVGIVGVPLGALTGACAVYLPIGLFTLAGGFGIPAGRVIGWVTPWIGLVALVFAPLAVLSVRGVASVWLAGGLLAGGLTGYALGIYALAARDPLRPYRDRVVAVVRRRLRKPGRKPVA
jgi:O-antigen/teichoic acid export membrane protein